MRTLLLSSALVMAATAAHAQSSPQDFTNMAASGGMFEIRSSEMILETDNLDPEVQAFAEQMVADHTKAAADLKAAAETAGTEVPAEPMPREAKKLEQLAAADDMLAMYLASQDVSHNNAVVLHRSYAEGGTDAALKSYAEAAVPVLEEHDGHIEMLHAENMK